MKTGRRNSSAKLKTFSVCTSTPATASISIKAASETCMLLRASCIKTPLPGVSKKLIFVLFHSMKAMAVEMLIFLSISSGSKSVMAVPSSTRPKRFPTPPKYRHPATSEVLPDAPCPVTATFLMLAPPKTFTISSFLTHQHETQIMKQI